MRESMVRLMLCGALVGGLLVLAPSTPAAAVVMYTVTTTDDVTSGGGALSLREAIAAANTDGDASVINLAASVEYVLNDCGPLNGLLRTTENEDLTIDGNGSTVRQTCAGGGVLYFASDGTLTISEITITGGRCDGVDCIAGGVGVGAGGSILVIRDSVITDNQTVDPSGGGGIFGYDLGTTLTRVVLSDNESNVGGAGIRSTGPLVIADSAIVDNHAGSGAAISHDETLLLVNSTITGNDNDDLSASAIYGNALADQAAANYDSVTIVGNDGPQVTESWLLISNTIVAQPLVFPNCNHPTGNMLDSHGGNYTDDVTCGLTHVTDIDDGVDPMLRPLFRNGGFAPSMYPDKGSPLLDVIAADSIIGSDQRGVPRPQNTLGDIGSIEVEVCHALFTDVVSDNPFCWEIGWLSGSGVTTGFPDGSYRPSDGVTRQSMAAFMYRLAGSPRGTDPGCSSAAFPDVSASHPFCGEIDWLVDEGITEGFADGNYRPTQGVTRQSMAAFMYRLAGAPGGPDPACVGPAFTDVPESHPFCGEIAAVADGGVAEGFPDGSYRPTNSVTRESMAAFMYRLADGLIA